MLIGGELQRKDNVMKVIMEVRESLAAMHLLLSSRTRSAQPEML